MTCCLYFCHTDYAVSHAVTVSALSKKMPRVCSGKALMGSRCTGSKKLASPQHPTPGASLPERAWEPAAAPGAGAGLERAPAPKPLARALPGGQTRHLSCLVLCTNPDSSFPPMQLLCHPYFVLLLLSHGLGSPPSHSCPPCCYGQGAPGAVQGSTHADFPGCVEASRVTLLRAEDPPFHTRQQRKPNYCFSSPSLHKQRVIPFLLIACTL